MATIGSYTATNTIDAANDYMLIQQSGVYKKISRNTLAGLSSAPVGLTDTQSPQNKTFDNTNTLTIKDGSFTLNNTADTTKVGVFSLANNTTGTTRTYTMPNASVTLASLTGTETLTNKTITSPTITGGTVDNSTITVDSISGHSVATTVTVANLQISNGVLNSANAVTATSIAAGAIQPQALVAGTGSGWAWTNYTPTFTNFTVGNATVASRYIQIGKTVFFNGIVTLGSSSSMGTQLLISYPVAPNASYILSSLLGSAFYVITNGWLGIATFNSNTTIELGTIGPSGSYDRSITITAAVPNTWTTGSKFSWQIVYEAA
jgi:hypothetical protein